MEKRQNFHLNSFQVVGKKTKCKKTQSWSSSKYSGLLKILEQNSVFRNQFFPCPPAKYKKLEQFNVFWFAKY